MALKKLPATAGRRVVAVDASIWIHRLGVSVDVIGVMVNKDYTLLVAAVVDPAAAAAR